MLDQLKTANAEQQKAILATMQAQQKDLLEAQRALGRQIRDELRKIRQSQPTGGR
jgi:4-aminobutyrate aminotransferase-like enzyme